MTNDMTGIETTTGDALLVELDEAAGTLRFLDEDETPVREFSLAAVSGVTEALAIDLDRGIVISVQAVAELKQWANLDATALKHRATRAA